MTDGGVGYRVYLPVHTLAALPAKGERLLLHTSLLVREDALDLYGFSTLEERQTFEILLGISKVGAKTAQAMLSVFRPDELKQMVLEERVDDLIRVPGIGKKSAQRIFLELKDKFKVLEGTGAKKSQALSGARQSVLDGLLGLGYAENEVYAVVQKIFAEQPELEVSEGLKAALKELGKGK